MRASEMDLRRWMASLFWLLLACFAALPAGAQENNIALAAYADKAPDPGGEVDVALVFTPAPGWHGYWSNPGDAGVGLQIDWTLPEGWQAGEPEFPVPETLVISGLMNHVYESPHAVIVPLRVPAGADLAEGPVVSAKLDWLACTDRICVPEHGDILLDFSGTAALAPEARFEQWRAELPPLIDRHAIYEVAGDELRLAIPLPAAMELGEPHVFIEQRQIAAGQSIAYAAPQTFRRAGDLLVAQVPLKGSAAGDAEAGTLEGILSFGNGGRGVRFVAEPGAVTGLDAPVIAGAAREVPSLVFLIGAALLGGLILNLMPCVFPILSLKALTLARAGGDERAARSEALAYSAGVVFACLALGGLMLALRAGSTQVGWAFQLQEPGVVVALLVLAALLTANFAGLFELPGLPIRGGGKPASAFGTGLLAAFVATPCTGPFMAAAMGAALLLPVPQALGLFAALGLGLALPFLLLGFVPSLRRMLPKPGAWMERFRKLMAIPMGLTALALVWLSVRIGGKPFALLALLLVAGLLMGLLVTGLLQRRGKLAWPAFGLIAAPFLVFAAFALPAAYDPASAGAEESIHDPVAFDELVLMDTVQSQGKPVFLWFTADWCLTCKVNERVAIERDEVRKAFEGGGVVAMRGDWTQADPEITAFLEQQGAAGVPLYLWYVPNQQPEKLPQVLTPEMLIERAKAR
ncbi:protein-disulfide reductase DsbD domain-containing protein [Aurantiacibacter sp. DGU5]|uniref:Protein-disulfide reductase DsbD domain-containing protein n=2 Tax=Aurantiacibacter flavus TaxID=3145232 RepID=A0ABV0CS86_9SPHN